MRFLHEKIHTWPALLVPIDASEYTHELMTNGSARHFRVSMADPHQCLLSVLGTVLRIGWGKRVPFKAYRAEVGRVGSMKYQEMRTRLGLSQKQAVACGFQIDLKNDPCTGYGTLNKVWWQNIGIAIHTTVL